MSDTPFDANLPTDPATQSTPDQLAAPTPDAVPFGKRRLGRGLNSLLASSSPALGDGPHADPANAAFGIGEFRQLDVDSIERNPYQPRTEFDEQALSELVNSIAEHGVLQPVLVRNTPNGWQLIAGERRLIASRRVGLKTIPVRVVDLQDAGVAEVAIIENLQRQDLNDLEKARAFQDYLDKFGCPVEDLARKLGKDRSTISNILRLLELPDFVKVAISQGKISASHGRALLPLEEESDQIAMCQRIQSETMSVRQTEEAVRQKLNESILPFTPPEAAKSAKGTKTATSNHVQSLEQQLRDQLGAKVELKMKGKDAGKIVIHFANHDEFERITGRLRKAA
jgi:ParB family transcriptional regulator, chromosome partitioning protein